MAAYFTFPSRGSMFRPTHFEIHAEQPERAIAFYQKMFGWTFSPFGPPGTYWLITTGPESVAGINGGLVPRRGSAPEQGQAVNAYICSLNVPAVDESVEAAVAQGGGVALPKMAIPGVGWLAYVKDTEGNIVGLMQADTSAA
jgi:uncharacterized protein